MLKSVSGGRSQHRSANGQQEVKKVFCSEALLDYVAGAAGTHAQLEQIFRGTQPPGRTRGCCRPRAPGAWLDARGHVIPEGHTECPSIGGESPAAELPSRDGTKALHGRDLATQLLELVAVAHKPEPQRMSALPQSRRLADWIERYRGVETGDVLLDRPSDLHPSNPPPA